MRNNFTATVMAMTIGAICVAAHAQPGELPRLGNPAPERAAENANGQQLEQMLAPIALYPDVLLTDILAASTNAAQIVEAQRFITAHGALRGTALANAAAAENWDPSVQALLAFPDVLRMMDGDLAWTDRLGHAVSAQQGDVLDAVQRLRLAAQRAGILRNGPQESVVNEGGDIALLPPAPQELYLPRYEPACVYGPGFAGASDCAGTSGEIDWDSSIVLPYGFGQWGLINWGRRSIRLTRRVEERDGPDGAAWHATRSWHVAALGHRGGATHFNYAPPAGQGFQHAGSNRPPIAPIRVASSSARLGGEGRLPERAKTPRAANLRSVGTAPALGGLHR